MRAATGLHLVALAAALAGPAGPGCSDGGLAIGTPLAAEEGCQPLLAGTEPDGVSRAGCLLPYPSDFYRAGPGSPIALPRAAQPRVAGDPGALADLHQVIATDGFSLVPSIVATLPSAITGGGLPNILDDPSRSATAASATLIVDAETGVLVPHYADVVARGLDAAHEPIVLRPFAPLAPRRRYVVALTGVRLAGSDPARLAPPPEGFRRLRDGAPDPALEPVRARFERDVFPVLARAGIAQRALQLAWDFTTGSEEEPRADMLRVRELTLDWLAARPPAVSIDAVVEEPDPAAPGWRTVQGTVTGPLFLEHPRPGARLARDDEGRVRVRGTVAFPFTAKVPASIRDGVEPGRVLAYGHGFFGSRTELDGEPARIIAAHLGAVEFGIDWWGMSKEDVRSVADTISSAPAHGADFTDRVHQAMANWIVMTAAIAGPLATNPAFARPAGGRAPGAPLYDPSFFGYFGASMGHILGGTLAALDPSLSRVVLNVGGGAFTHIMPRSGSFGAFSLVLDTTFKDELWIQAYAAMLQRALDRIDPASYAPLVVERPLPGSRPRRVLLQIGIGDTAVPNAASFLHARALGAQQTLPAPHAIYGLAPADATSAAAITLFDYGIDVRGWAEPRPLPLNRVHDTVRVNPRALAQMDAFFRPDGAIVHPCDGPCDPE